MNILCFGSLNIDNLYTVPHFVRAGETLSSSALQRGCGGKGLNQSIALARAGIPVRHAGLIGNDGEMLRDFLQANGVDVSLVRTIKEPSGHAIIQLDGERQNSILLYGGANQKITPEFIEEVLSRLEPGDILLLQNEINRLEEIVRKAAGRKIRIALNPAPVSDNLSSVPFEMVEWLFVNEIEGAALSGETEPQRILGALRGRYPQMQIILTLGKNGALYRSGELTLHQPIVSVPVVDTTAAGDTFIGYYMAAVLQGQPASAALQQASAAAALAVSKIGAARSIPVMDEVSPLVPCW